MEFFGISDGHFSCHFGCKVCVVTSSSFLFCSCLETDATFQVPRKRGITVMLDLQSASSYSSQWNLVKQTKKIKVFLFGYIKRASFSRYNLILEKKLTE